jgi:hypothetical protein
MSLTDLVDVVKANQVASAGVALLALGAGIYKLLTPPAELAHLPRVPIFPLLCSYAKGEVEDQRIKRLIVPFANERQEGAVLVYAFGRWIVHVVDHKVCLLYPSL